MAADTNNLICGLSLLRRPEGDALLVTNPAADHYVAVDSDLTRKGGEVLLKRHYIRGSGVTGHLVYGRGE